MNVQPDGTSCGIYDSMYLLDMYELAHEIFTKKNLRNDFKDIPNKEWRSQNICKDSIRAEISKLLDIFFVELKQKMPQEPKEIDHFGDSTFKHQWEREVYHIPELNKGYCIPDLNKTEANKQWDDALRQWKKINSITVSGQTFEVSKHRNFDAKNLLLVDLSPLPEEIFDKKRYPQYEDMVTNPAFPKPAYDNFNGLRYMKFNNPISSFEFPTLESNGDDGNNDDNTTKMGAVITELLAKYAGMERSFPVAENWKFSFLCTAEEALQEPHVDYKWDALRRHHKKAEGKYPWSLDLPLTDGGLQLAVWGPDTGDDECHIPPNPTRIVVPHKKMILWR